MEEKHPQSTRQRARTPTGSTRLTPNHIAMIEEAIVVVGEFGEVHLIVNQGCLHYITAQKSFNAKNYSPGRIIADFEHKTK